MGKEVRFWEKTSNIGVVLLLVVTMVFDDIRQAIPQSIFRSLEEIVG